MKPTDKNLLKVTYQIKRYYSSKLKRYLYRIEFLYKSMKYDYITLEVIEDILYKKQADKLANLLQNKNWSKEIERAKYSALESIVNANSRQGFEKNRGNYWQADLEAQEYYLWGYKKI